MTKPRVVKKKPSPDEIDTRTIEFAVEIMLDIGIEGEMQGDEYIELNSRYGAGHGQFKFNTKTGVWSDDVKDSAEVIAEGVGLISYMGYATYLPPDDCARMLFVWLKKRQLAGIPANGVTCSYFRGGNTTKK